MFIKVKAYSDSYTRWINTQHILEITACGSTGSSLFYVDKDASRFDVEGTPEEIMKLIGDAMYGFSNIEIKEIIPEAPIPSKPEYTVQEKINIALHMLHESSSVIDNQALAITLDKVIIQIQRAVGIHSRYLKNFTYKSPTQIGI